MGKISVVTTAYNELETIPELYKRLKSVLVATGKNYEIIFVDDASSDGSTGLLKSIASKDKDVKVIVLSRNFGQHSAVAAGFKHCSGDIVIWMDADLQDVPENIPMFISKIEEGYDIVYGVPESRGDPFYKKIGAKLVFALFEKLSGCKLPKGGVSTLRALKREVVEAFNVLPEHSRFTAGMIAWLGFSYSVIPVKHEERKKGRSKYGLLKLSQLSLNAIISFSDYPLKILSNIGIGLSLLSVSIGAFMVYRKLTAGFVISGYASLIVSIFFLFGLQFFFMGILGEYIARVFKDVQGRPVYVIKEKINL